MAGSSFKNNIHEKLIITESEKITAKGRGGKGNKVTCSYDTNLDISDEEVIGMCSFSSLNFTFFGSMCRNFWRNLRAILAGWTFFGKTERGKSKRTSNRALLAL